MPIGEVMQIEILDVIDCRIKKALADIIRPELSYTAVFYQQGPYKKIRKEYEKSIMKKGSDYYYFPTGLLPRVLAYCKERNVDITITGKAETLSATNKTSLKGIVLREEQQRLVDAAIKKGRGSLVASTGQGKTYMGLAVVSAFKNAKTLWLCHTLDLMYQAAERAKEVLPHLKQGFIGDSKCSIGDITFATRQSFSKQVGEYGCVFDIIIVDELHHASSIEYETILQHVLAPIRIGLTATLPKEKSLLLSIEGSIGPIIEEITIEEGQERGTMAEIKIKFLKVPIDHNLKQLRKYADVYKAGVVENKLQHKIIVNTAIKHINKNESVLILVTQIEHGYNLQREFERQGIEVTYAQGATESEDRLSIKNALNKKHCLCVIATTIFKEGIDIPELDVIINAAGGKSEIATIQAVGRGLRLTKTKKTLTYYDILNTSHNYLIDHIANRLETYTSMNWL